MRRLLRAAGAALVTLGIGAAGAACPSRELVVQVTADGVSTVAVACESFRGACTGKSCLKNRILCDPDTCTLRNACQLDNGAEWAPLETMALQVILSRVDRDGVHPAEKSPCVPLNLRPCFRDPLSVIGCPDAPSDAYGCLTDVVDGAVRRALGSGLSYDGFRSPDDGLLTIAVFQKPGHEASCEPDVLVGPLDCAEENLVAAAGLAAPLGAATFDITCAACQGSTHTAVGRDTGPCPVTADACFLQRVAGMIAEIE